MTPTERKNIDDRFAATLRLHQAGQLGGAEAGYREILGLDGGHAGSLHGLGIIALQRGHNAAAVELIGKAIAADARNPEQHYHIGLALGALGRLREVADHARKAIALKPDYAQAHLNLGKALAGSGELEEAALAYKRAFDLDQGSADAPYNLGNVRAQQGRLEEAVVAYRQAARLNPLHGDALSNLGATLIELGRADEAVTHLQTALAANPRLVAASVNLGNALLQQGKLDEASASYERALAQEPTLAQAHANLGLVRATHGRRDEALAHYRRAIALSPALIEARNNLAEAHLAAAETREALGVIMEALRLGGTLKTKALFVQCLKGRQAGFADAALRDPVRSALEEPWGEPVDLISFAASLVRQSGVVRDALAGALSPQSLAALGEDRLLLALLRAAPNTDVELERVLGLARRALLERASAEIEPSTAELNFACALAQQAFMTDYVLDEKPEERRPAETLRDALAERLDAGEDIPPLWLAAAAAYAPLHVLAAGEALLRREWPEPIAALLTQQLREPRQEREYRASMPALTPIEDETSRAVRRQYEENPYPRWGKLAAFGKPLAFNTKIRRQFPLAPFHDLAPGPLDMLIAGCGTGRHAVEAAQGYADAKVLAIDLSQASLAYAKRRTRELGVATIDYAQADILRLDSLGRSFDVIEAGGVLHHLAEPLAGWRVLLRLLRPNGCMRIGLYSELARRDVAAVRSFIAERGYGASDADIRACRQELLRLPHDDIRKNVTRSSDFFSVSGCRDLLFHVEEHRFTLAAIRTFLGEHDLGFLGFTVDASAKRRYGERFPSDRAMTDLAQWDAFEKENPSTFWAMYDFWVQRR